LARDFVLIVCNSDCFKLAQTTIGRGILSMVITCVGRTMVKELFCFRQLLLGEESIVCIVG